MWGDLKQHFELKNVLGSSLWLLLKPCGIGAGAVSGLFVQTRAHHVLGGLLYPVVTPWRGGIGAVTVTHGIVQKDMFLYSPTWGGHAPFESQTTTVCSENRVKIAAWAVLSLNSPKIENPFPKPIFDIFTTSPDENF